MRFRPFRLADEQFPVARVECPCLVFHRNLTTQETTMRLGYLLGGTLFAAASLLAPLQSARADSQAFVDGIGAAKCSQIATDIQARPEVVANSLVHWAYGYMTRRNYEQAVKNQTQVDLTKDFDAKKMLGTMLGICQKNPDVHIIEVVDALYEVMLKDQTPSA